uniref:ZP domain-containing protein n=1 Tax=Electrophorus electricus TaxID=8005 RepID=A0A4W4F228_ELEEL
WTITNGQCCHIMAVPSWKSSLAFCLEVGSKAHDPFKISDTISQFGKLAVGKGSRITLRRTEVNNGTEDGVTANLEGHQSDESGSAGKYLFNQVVTASVLLHILSSKLLFILLAWYKVAQTKLQLLNPSVLCGDDAMTLHVHGNRLPNFMVDRGGSGLVPLSRMPANCGFSVKRARRDVFIIAQYKGCHITQHGDSYVLPLRLWGAPVHMSCPMAPHVLPTVTCLSFGMVTKISGISTEALKLKVNGIWEPIMSASSACGFTTEAVTDGVAIVAPYRGSCWQDGEKLLYLLGEDEELTLSCHDQDPNGYDPNVAPTTGSIATIPDAPDLVFDNVVTKSPPTKSLLASTPSTYAAAVVPANEHPPVYPFPPMYYPFGHVYSHHTKSEFVSNVMAGPSSISNLRWNSCTGCSTPFVSVYLACSVIKLLKRTWSRVFHWCITWVFFWSCF